MEFFEDLFKGEEDKVVIIGKKKSKKGNKKGVF